MEWYVLVLMLILPSLSRADCSAQCLKCAEQTSDLNSPVNRLTCTLECEGTLTSTIELDRCEKALQALLDDLKGLSEDFLSEEDLQEPASNLVKRYGGFIKRIDRNKNKILISPWKENAIQKGLFAKNYGDALLKLVERNVPELSEDEDEGEDVTSENEMGVYDNDLPLNEFKRYGGFLRKFGPKRSDSMDESNQQELQKRYGGFMRRIRPKLKWDNQKRYGGFLRRHFKISVRSDEEPSLLHD
ncbi:proenkephalin-B [Electrophorus electricus]|uniref:Proenkephalin-B n=1 Tax=Electrophorus electricus TaxID=8005 RepID=A0AAY5F0R7_ELEEL|nr:proenkephalin-B [Electrophorus electricus]